MKPRALDLFCGAGGASRGLQLAGFHVTGVDIKPQPRYCGDVFYRHDALTFPINGFDFIWASPPCQAFTSMRWMPNAKEHPDLIPATRAGLRAAGVPSVIENVEGAPLEDPLLLCGTMLGMGTPDAELWRHRLFECSGFYTLRPQCRHRIKPRVIGVYGGHGRDRRRTTAAKDFSIEERMDAMGINWMTMTELSQAIPPAFAMFIGHQALQVIREGAA